MHWQAPYARRNFLSEVTLKPAEKMFHHQPSQTCCKRPLTKCNWRHHLSLCAEPECKKSSSIRRWHSLFFALCKRGRLGSIQGSFLRTPPSFLFARNPFSALASILAVRHSRRYDISKQRQDKEDFQLFLGHKTLHLQNVSNSIFKMQI